MALDRNSNAYTFGFSIIMVVIVGSILASLSMGLKPLQKKNEDDKKMMDILATINVEATRGNAAELFEKYIESYVVDFNGNKIEGGKNAFDVDIKKDFKNRALADEDKSYPLYVANIDGNAYYIIPMVGAGLWGPIWGFVAVGNDFKSIYGAKFDHKGETPGLGAEIKEADFTKRFTETYGTRIMDMDADKPFIVLKGGKVPAAANEVDGITGGTITSVGVGDMINRTVKIYGKHFSQLN